MNAGKNIWVGVALLLTCATSAFSQSTWYVDMSATPPGAGTQAEPYTSIQYAVDQATTLSDDLILVAPGIYSEQVRCPSKFLKLRSTHGPSLTMIRPTLPGDIVQMPNGLAGSTFPELDGFRLQGSASMAGSGVVSTDIVVKNCIIDAGYDASATVFAGVQAMVSVRLERSTIVNFGRAVTLNNFFGSPDETRLSNSILDRGVMGTSLSLEYCQWNGQLGGAILLAGNVNAPPGVWSPPSGDVHLKPLSPCIDAAKPSLPPDPDGSRADIGAMVYDPAYAATPTTYCTAKSHSGGCSPRLGFSGSASFSGPDDFHVQCADALNRKAGLIFFGAAPANLPFSGGTLCVAAPIVRGPAQNSGGSSSGVDCTGSFDLHFSHAFAQANGIAPGTNVYLQAWGRDPGFVAPNNIQLSDAAVFEFAP